MNLVIFGLGYTSQHFAQEHGATFSSITATVRSPERAQALTQPGLDVLAFSNEGADPRIEAALADCDVVLLSIPPEARGDPVLLRFAQQIAAAPRLRSIVYLSTVGVYGDHGGAVIDESAACHPSNDRSRWRLAAENAWIDFGEATGKAVHVLRLAGIYGPGQNALVNLKAGTARRIVKPGQVFNRIHVADIGRAIAAAFAAKAGGVWNVSDDEPAPPQDVVAYAAKLLGVEPPPEVSFDEANLSPMARSFYAECKRVSNAAMKTKLGVQLAYPTYREALDALYAAGDGR
jgi:nucleoside-diphosphate-sugar epimerase